MRITIDDVTVLLFFFLVGLVMLAACLWALAEEERLGISGMSSERILVREEMKEIYRDNYNLRYPEQVYRKK